MRSRMRSIDVLKIRLEVGVVPRERVDREIHVLFRERGVDHQLGISGGLARRRGEVAGEEGLQGIITADVVRNGIGDLHILETTGRDLVIVRRVTPRS